MARLSSGKVFFGKAFFGTAEALKYRSAHAGLEFEKEMASMRSKGSN